MFIVMIAAFILGLILIVKSAFSIRNNKLFIVMMLFGICLIALAIYLALPRAM